jgi:hypothetical protein
MRQRWQLRIGAVAVGVLLAFWLSLPALTASEDGRGVKAFVGARIIDGTGRPPWKRPFW